MSQVSESSRPSDYNVREQWSGQLQFILSCLGYAVGLANVWRFPYLAYSNGGGAFFIPYFIMLFFVGIPIFFLEVSLGQFSSSGPTACWDFCQLFQGLGIAMSMVSGLTAIYYNVIIGWAVFYFFASVQPEVPWRTCGDWSTPLCFTRIRYLTKLECRAGLGTVNPTNGVCKPPNNSSVVWLWNRDLAMENGIFPSFPAKEYFERRVTGIGLGNTITNLGPPRFELILCLAFAWIVVTACISRGIKSSGKVVYVTATFPYFMLSVLLIRGLTLDGALDGIKFYLLPDLQVLKTAKVWKDAAVQIFFSLASAYGGLIALASYNTFHADILRDTMIVGFGNSFTSIYAGFVIFSFLGFLAKVNNSEIKYVAASGPSLAFGVYPFSLTLIPGTIYWSLVFFVMLIMLGIDSQMVLVETVITSIVDMAPNLRYRKLTLTLSICFCMFLIGLIMTTNGGIDVLDLMDTYAGGWNVLIIALCECIAVGWFYGTERFNQDISAMIGNSKYRTCKFGPYCQLLWGFCWTYITPALCLFVTLFSWVNYTRIERFPFWIDIFAWAITMSSILGIIGMAVRNVYLAPATGFDAKFRYATTPNKWWGPALPEHRMLVVKYVPNFKIYPGLEDLPVVPVVKEEKVAKKPKYELKEKQSLSSKIDF